MISVDLKELMFKEEPLHPELEPYVVHSKWGGQMIHHPLIIEIFFQPKMCALVNWRYEQLKAKAAECYEQGNWNSYIYTHEKPYRLRALLRCHEAGLRGKEYWECVGSVWTNSENIHQGVSIWKQIWNQKDHAKMACMDPMEQEKFHSLCSTITVWRGTQYKSSVRGLSWTLNKAKAAWFAHRYFDKRRVPLLVHGEVRKHNVHAYFAGRNESEIVSNKVKVQQIEEL